MNHTKYQPLERATFAVDPDTRTISGRAVTWGEVGNGSTGRTIFKPHSIVTPDDLSAVKLLLMHDDWADAAGELTSVSDNDAGLDVTFTIYSTDTGNEALKDAAGPRDGLSVGVNFLDSGGITKNGDTAEISKATLREVSLVTVPAFPSSRVEHDKANEPNDDGTLPAPEATPQPAAESEQEMPETTIATETPKDATANNTAIATFAAVQGAPALQAQSQHEASTIGLAAVEQLISMSFKNGSLNGLQSALEQINNATAAQFALTDVVPAGDTGGFNRPQWLGQLWQLSRTDRPIIDLFGRPKQLTSLNVNGFGMTKPTVAKWAGAKTDVPSSPVTFGPKTSKPQPIAGAWDIAREYVDLGSPEIVSTILTAAMDSYLTESEAYIRGLVTGQIGATSVSAASITALLTEIGISAATIGAQVRRVLLSPDAFRQLSNLTTNDAAWWLPKTGGIQLGTATADAGGVPFQIVPELTGVQAVAVDARAITVLEKQPIRLQALNLPQGGIDVGLFGYVAAVINDVKAIIKGTVTVTPPAGN